MTESSTKVKQLEDHINEVDYHWLNNVYIPSPEAIEFINFIKMVNAKEGEEHKSPCNAHADG